MPVRGVPLPPEWAKLRDGIEDRGVRARLYGLMRYCSGRAIKPDLVDDAIYAGRRSVARTWNTCIGEIRWLAAAAVVRAAGALWISFTTVGPMTPKNLGILVSKVTLEILGVDVSPHLFRTAAASTAANNGGSTPHLASAILNHTDPRVTEEHCNRASSVRASKIYARITANFFGTKGSA